MFPAMCESLTPAGARQPRSPVSNQPSPARKALDVAASSFRSEVQREEGEEAGRSEREEVRWLGR